MGTIGIACAGIMIPEETAAGRQPHNFSLPFGEAKKKKQTNKTTPFCLYSRFDPGQTSFSKI